MKELYMPKEVNFPDDLRVAVALFKRYLTELDTVKHIHDGFETFKDFETQYKAGWLDGVCYAQYIMKNFPNLLIPPIKPD